MNNLTGESAKIVTALKADFKKLNANFLKCQEDMAKLINDKDSELRN